MAMGNGHSYLARRRTLHKGLNSRKIGHADECLRCELGYLGGLCAGSYAAVEVVVLVCRKELQVGRGAEWAVSERAVVPVCL